MNATEKVLAMARDVRLGRAIRALEQEKASRGVDWCIHSSWTSDRLCTIVLVRPAGWKGPATPWWVRAIRWITRRPAAAHARPLARPIVRYDILQALEDAVEVARG